MKLVLPVIFALQIALSPLCMTQMARAEEMSSPDATMSMAGSEHAMHSMNHADHGDPQKWPCGQKGDCFSQSSLQSAPSPDLELPMFVAAALPVPIATLTGLVTDAALLPPPEDPPPISIGTETVVLLC